MGRYGMSSSGITIHDEHAVSSNAYRLQQSETSFIVEGSFKRADHSV